MTRNPTRMAGRTGLVRDNPDVLAISLLALTLLIVNPGFAASIYPVFDGGVTGAPWACESRLFQSGPEGLTAGPRFRLSPIASADARPEPELRLDEWGARIDERRERLWHRLEQRMRQLELRILMHENHVQTRTVSAREE